MLIVQLVLSYLHVDLMNGIVAKLFLTLKCRPLCLLLISSQALPGQTTLYQLVASISICIMALLYIALIYYLSSEQTIPVTSTKTAFPNRFAHMTSELRACIQDPSGYTHQPSTTFHRSLS